jgi:serine/threonine protein kinase
MLHHPGAVMRDGHKHARGGGLPHDETSLMSPADVPVPLADETALLSPDEIPMPVDLDRTTRMGRRTAENTVPVSPEDSLAIAWESELLGRLRTAVAGQYEITGRLGRGGMGAVYLASDVALDRRVAIKVMLPDLNARDKHAERFRQEARTGAALSHPNIVPVYAVSERDDLLYFVMKYVEGRSLEGILKDAGRLPPSMVQSILHQVGSGLAYGHSRGVIHRDMKPANIMIDVNGLALIADFGVAKVLGAQDLTMTGTAVGTPQYMSPEQCRGSRAQPASDQYSLGIVAYQMLTGQAPFQGQAIGALITQHLFDDPPAIEEALPDCPPELGRTVMRMLEKMPKARFRTLDEALSHLGGHTLEHGDPARTQIIELARAVPEPESLDALTTPVSPIPMPAATGTQVVRSWRRSSRRGVLATLGAAALIATLAPLNGWINLTPGNDAVPASAESPLGGTQIANRDGMSDADVMTSPADSARGRDEMGQTAGQPDSGAAGAGEGSAAHETQPARGPSPTVAAPVVESGSIMLGTRGLAAELLVNGEPQGFISRLRSWTVAPGQTRIAIRMDGCTPWDTTVVVNPGQETRIGYRNPGCSP